MYSHRYTGHNKNCLITQNLPSRVFISSYDRDFPIHCVGKINWSTNSWLHFHQQGKIELSCSELSSALFDHSSFKNSTYQETKTNTIFYTIRVHFHQLEMKKRVFSAHNVRCSQGNKNVIGAIFTPYKQGFRIFDKLQKCKTIYDKEKLQVFVLCLTDRLSVPCVSVFVGCRRTTLTDTF